MKDFTVMTPATVTGNEGIFWRPSAALRVAHKPTQKHSLAATVLAAICAFTLILFSSPTVSNADALEIETGVAAQTDLVQALVRVETAASPVFVGPNGSYGYDGVSGCCVAPGSAAVPSPGRWKVGDPIDQLTAAGNVPTWGTSQSRYWKNRGAGALDGEFSPANLERMRSGRAPLHDELGVPMELHHVDPQRLGGANTPANLMEVWPWEHAAIDPYRHYNGPRPG